MKKGFVCGCFDIIHPGYIKLLEEARSKCDWLIVGLQTDPTLDRPEKNKPVQTYEERELILKSIRYVDQAIKYETESDLYRLLKKLKPDVWIMGTDKLDTKYTGYDLKINTFYHNRSNYSSTKLKQQIQDG